MLKEISRMNRLIAPAVALAHALALSACAAYSAPEATAPAAPEGPQLSLDTMKEVTRVLSSDAFEGRYPGTAGEEKTMAYLVKQYEEAGLQPGNNGSWFQDVPLVDINASNFSPLTISGKGEPFTFAQGEDFVTVSYRAVPHTEIADSDLVFVGYGINAPEKGWNDYAGIDMKGKTAVILVNDPDYETPTIGGEFNGKAMTYYGRWTYKFEEAARQGAEAAIIIHDTYPAAYGWNVVESSWTGPQSYAQSADNGMSNTKANGWIQLEAARELFSAVGLDLSEQMEAAKQKGFRPVPLGLKASVSFDNAIRTVKSRNVVGVLPGTKRPDEYVLFTAHWDHLGRCKPNSAGDDICNGAIDNATGTAALVTLAKAYGAAGGADRSLVFLAVTAEEQGLLGSEYYAANPVFPLDHTVGGVNMDALSLAGPAKDVTVVGGGKSELDGYLKTVLDSVGRYATPDPNPQNGYYYRSDHFSLAKRGVPMFYVDAGEDLVKGGREAGAAVAADYTQNRYHGPDDEYDPNWDWSGALSDLTVFYKLGMAMANTTDWPNWLPGDEFRATRDKSCASSPDGC
jgi:Zn-dependent M28 family amino/carboxypeptidase